MKKIILILWVFACMTCFSACAAEGSITETGRDDIYHMVANGVPYAGNADYKTDRVYHKETDSYGRELFLYKTALYGVVGRQDVWIISQKTNQDCVYYYEDVFYRTDPTGEGISQGDLSLLKERNDWNKPLDSSKMVELCYNQSADHRPDYAFQLSKGEEIKNHFRKEFRLPQTYRVVLDGLGTDRKGSVIFLVLTKKGKTAEDVVGRYLARINRNLDPDSIEYLPIEEGFNLQQQLPSFRAG